MSSSDIATINKDIIELSIHEETEELSEFEDPSVEVDLPVALVSKRTRTLRSYRLDMSDDEDKFDCLTVDSFKKTPLPTTEAIPKTPVPEQDGITAIWELIMREHGLDGNNLVGEHGDIPDDIAVYPADYRESPSPTPEVYVNPRRAGRPQVKTMPGMKEQVTRDTPIKKSGKRMIRMTDRAEASPNQQEVLDSSTITSCGGHPKDRSPTCSRKIRRAD